MGKEILTFGDIEIEKSNIFLEDVDIEKVLVSHKISFGEKCNKYFIGYLYNDHKIKPLHIMLPKTSDSVKSFDMQTKGMFFFIKDDDLLEKINTIWDKDSAEIEKNLIASLSTIKYF